MAEEKGQGPRGPVAPADLSENRPGAPAGDAPAAGGPPDGEESGTPLDLVEDAEADELERPSAPPVLDEAHVGDIKGALGTIRLDDVAPQGSWRGRLVVLLAIMGPGLIVMVGDNDAGGVSTYAQAGQNYGTSLLWVLVLLIPVLIVNQEMVVRLGAVTGVGHARLILERFGRFWGSFSVIDLFVLNFLTIVTEFIGVDLALTYFGLSKYLTVPIAAVAADRDDDDRQLREVGAADVRLRRRQPARRSRSPSTRTPTRARSPATSSFPGSPAGSPRPRCS